MFVCFSYIFSIVVPTFLIDGRSFVFVCVSVFFSFTLFRLI